MAPDTLPTTVRSAAHRVDRTRAELGEASTQHRAALALLASEIRQTAINTWTVKELTVEVARRMELAPRTVQNALFETFRVDVFSACLHVLAERATGKVRRAA